MNFSLLSMFFGAAFFLFVGVAAFHYIRALYFQFFITKNLSLKERMNCLVRDRYFEKMAMYALFASINVLGLSWALGSYYLLGRGLILTAVFLVWWVWMRYSFRNLDADLKRTKQILGED